MPADRMTEAEALELERLEKAATPGPWTVLDQRAETAYRREHPKQMVLSDVAMRSVVTWGEVDETRRSDHALIAAARNALPKLLAERRALTAERDRAREMLTRHRKVIEDAMPYVPMSSFVAGEIDALEAEHRKEIDSWTAKCQ